MNTLLNKPVSYHDISHLQQMRFDAQNNEKQTLEAVAEQLEGVFLNMVLKNMREANNSFKSDLFSSSSTDFYHEMHDQQLALTLSQNGSIGLKDILVKQLSPLSDEAVKSDGKAISEYLSTQQYAGKV